MEDSTQSSGGQRRLSRRNVLIGLGAIGVAAAAGGTAFWWLNRHQSIQPLIYQASDAVFSLAWSPDSTRIVTASSSAQIWEAATGKTLLTYRGHVGELQQAIWSSDGARIASYAPADGIHIWEAATGKTLITFNAGNQNEFPQSIAWSPDGTRLLCVGSEDENRIQIYDTATGKMLFSSQPVNGMSAVAWSPDGTRIATAGDNVVEVWAATPGDTPLLRYQVNSDEGDRTIFALSWSSDSRQIVSGAYKGLVNVWDVAAGNALLTYHAHASVLSAAWSPNSAQFGISTLGTIEIVDAKSGKQDMKFTGSYAVAWSPDGKHLAFANLGTVEVLQVR